MNRHRTDTLSLVAGLLFVAIAGWSLSGGDRDARILGWFLAGALVLFGLLGLVRTVRRASADGPAVPGTAGQVPGTAGHVPPAAPDDDLFAPAPGSGPAAPGGPYAPAGSPHPADAPVTAPPGGAAEPPGSHD